MISRRLTSRQILENNAGAHSCAPLPDAEKALDRYHVEASLNPRGLVDSIGRT
jgi:hypothetical protein